MSKEQDTLADIINTYVDITNEVTADTTASIIIDVLRERGYRIVFVGDDE